MPTLNRISSSILAAAIEKLNSLKIGDLDIAEILLVILGLKPATAIYIYSHNQDPKTAMAEIKSMPNIYAEFGNLKDLRGENLYLQAVINIAESPKLLSELWPLSPILREQDSEAYGRLMGYPDSAIQAFMGWTNRLDELPDWEAKIDRYYPLGFAMSADNYQQELSLMILWEEAIKQYLPEIYARSFSIFK